MEEIEFSKPKLALAIFTAPRQAFEEIIERRLLGSALVIAGISGLCGFLWHLLGVYRGLNSVYDFGVHNPISSIAWVLGVSLGVHSIAKMSGGQGSLADTVTGVGWSHVVAAVSFVISAGAMFSQTLAVVSLLAYIYFVVACTLAIERAHELRAVKAAGAVILGFLSVYILRSITTSVAVVLNPALNQMNTMAGSRPIAEPAYLAALAVLGSVTLYTLLMRMKVRVRRRLLVSLGAFAAVGAVAGGLTLLTVRLDPIGHLKSGISSYSSGRYSKAAAEFRSVESIFPGDFQSRFYLAESYLGSRRFVPAEKLFRNLVETSGNSRGNMDVGRALTGLGAVAYARGDYKKAVQEFDKAMASWPNYREAHSRRALALLMMGKQDEARKAAEKAIEDGADSGIPFVVLTQVYTLRGDAKKASDSFKMLTKRDKELAAELGSSPQGWRTLADRLPAESLRFPIDTEPAKVILPQPPSRRR